MFLETLSSSTFSATVSAMKVYLFWNTMHWGAIQFYQHFCAPKTFIGYIMTPLMSQTPHCRTAHWIHQTSTNAFNSITTLIVSWGTSFVSKWFSIKSHTN
jgi:hypothetical protein